jgi:transposase-like protein
VCRKAYATEAEAERCLAACMHRHVNPPSTVATEQHGSKKRYRCHFCKRVYDAEQPARACAAECKKRTQEVIAQDKQEKTTARPPGATAGGASSPAKAPLGRPAGAGPRAEAATTAPPAASTSAAEAPTRHNQRAPVRRDDMHKFLREGRKLICRKCGAEHPTLDTVIACYDSHPEKQARPAATSDDEKFFRDGAKYVCRTCQKKWFTRVEAVACYDGHGDQASSAKAAPAAPASAPAATATSSGSTSSRAGSLDDDTKFFRDGAKYVCRSCGKKVFTRTDVIACFDGHAGAPAATVDAPVEAPASPSAPAPAPLGNAADDDAKFYRDGAKYVCRKCNKKVFTRVDVIACFDAHA